MKRRILFVSSPASALGKGDGGGVETTLFQLAPALANRGDTVGIIAPGGSTETEGATVYQIPGPVPANVTTSPRDSQVITSGYGVLEAMWDCAHKIQNEYDVIVGMTYDWLSYFLSTYFSKPVLHWITISSTVTAIDKIIKLRFAQQPERIGFYSRTQAQTFDFIDLSRAAILYGAVDTQAFPFSAKPEQRLCWVARISPEKGLEDALSVAAETRLPIDICGKMQDLAYWQAALDSHQGASVTYHGMLAHSMLHKVVGGCVAMLATPKWVEAFGLTVLEALACGTPVISYRRGGPSEIIEDRRSGYLVTPDDIGGLVGAVNQLPSLKREDARRRAEEFSIDRLAQRFSAWVDGAI